MTAPTGDAPLRVANCSGFYGDRLSAAREMVEGGPIDVLTGDWLAELTMLILAGARAKGRPGYAGTFLTQMEQVLGTCLDRGVKIVSNAGGLDPAGCARAVSELAGRLGLTARVAHVSGDDLTGRDLGGAVNLDTGERLTAAPLTANAYLGGLPIAVALEAGADVVVTGRVTDAALVTGPGMWRFGWRPGDPAHLDALAGSVVAGHVIECGCQATGGNYAFFGEVPDLPHCGFPIAELHADGSSVITKHPGTGGLVSVGTVTAQLLYEIGSPRYLGPDVTARFDTIRLAQQGPDRVAITGVRGEPPPETLKVALNHLGGYRNTMTLVLTGLDIEAKARLAEEAVFARVPREAFDQVHTELVGTGPGAALLRLTVMDADRRRAGRAFSSAVVETGLAAYPGFYALSPPGDASPYGVYWPTTVPASDVEPQVWLNDTLHWQAPTPAPRPADPAGAVQPATPDASVPSGSPGPPTTPPDTVPAGTVTPDAAPDGTATPPPADWAVTREVPLGLIAGARSGDKGGDANLGVWVRTEEQYAWLERFLTTDRLAALLPDTAPLTVERHALPNLRALNFVVHALLGRGVAASPRMDAQAKALGEELRARPVPIPVTLLADVAGA
ncbi:acyclic terpene utilization AtuA family protein [Sphaerisporangium sp. TRM90804]|uniref:acyclic terpene utilization AtuA family protein n=1 Tax=Sphaerisporangium sp. TRM90804 TaxID=3031113 RepID=UPI00244AFC3A|nr:acyclic terpene utilization AtuA family protein [Sphaerisporangium sp. TRM90804]MDH2424072.1 acyclic terpene utilization AtuA family protein [Sphaerisporangium sp. TRM90804]